MSTEEKLVVFELDRQEFALPILEVKEIIRIIQITSLPSASSFLKGIINLRGQIIPIINLYRLLNLDEKEPDHDSRIMVVENNANRIGIMVDQVREVTPYKHSDIESPDSICHNLEFISGFIQRDESILQLLKLTRLEEKL